jgi:hypothetical protein
VTVGLPGPARRLTGGKFDDLSRDFLLPHAPLRRPQ